MKFTGDLAEFSAVEFEIGLAESLKIDIDRVKVTESVAGSIVISFEVAGIQAVAPTPAPGSIAASTPPSVHPTFNATELQNYLSNLQNWQPGQIVGKHTLLQTQSLRIVDSTPPPPYCGDLNGFVLLFGWCDFEGIFVWNDEWGGVFVWVGGVLGAAVLLIIIVKVLRKLLDNSISPAMASQSIKMAMAHNAAETVRLATKDHEIMRTNFDDYLYERIGQFFRLWAFECDYIHYDDWKLLKSQARAFRMWADPTIMPGLTQKDEKRWDMLMLGAGKVEYAMDVEMHDLNSGGFAGIADEDVVLEEQVAIEKEAGWNKSEDYKLRTALMRLSDGECENPGWVPPGHMLAIVQEQEYPGQGGRMVQDLRQRWKTLQTVPEADLYKSEETPEEPKVDIMEAYRSSAAQKMLKRVAAKLMKQNILDAVQQWNRNMSDDAALVWQQVGVRMINPLIDHNSGKELE